MSAITERLLAEAQNKAIAGIIRRKLLYERYRRLIIKYAGARAARIDLIRLEKILWPDGGKNDI